MGRRSAVLLSSSICRRGRSLRGLCSTTSHPARRIAAAMIATGRAGASRNGSAHFSRTTSSMTGPGAPIIRNDEIAVEGSVGKSRRNFGMRCSTSLRNLRFSRRSTGILEQLLLRATGRRAARAPGEHREGPGAGPQGDDSRCRGAPFDSLPSNTTGQVSSQSVGGYHINDYSAERRLLGILKHGSVRVRGYVERVVICCGARGDRSGHPMLVRNPRSLGQSDCEAISLPGH